MNNYIKRKIKKAVVITVGVLCVLVGLAGFILPLLPGWFFFAVGALLLSMYSPKLRSWIHDHTVKYPRLHKFVERAEEWTVRVVGAPEVD